MFDRFDALFQAFAKSGHSLYYVGGSVRDVELGLTPKDFDFATDARPDTTKEVLIAAGLPWFPIGEKFGTLATKTTDGYRVEITTYRRDLTEGRRPEVAFSDSLEEDLSRRDFRMNSMARSQTGALIDPFGGQADIKNKVIACTGDAFARFAEDPLRMLRAIRFVSRLGFSLEKRTEHAIVELGTSILSVSRERWLEEMDKLLVGQHVQKAIELLARTKLLWLLIPEMLAVWQVSQLHTKAHKDLWHHTKVVVDRIPPRPDARWAALLHDISKPQTEGIKDGKLHFLGHDMMGADTANGIARRLKMSNERRRSICGLIFLHQRVAAAMEDSKTVSMRVLRRLVRECEERNCRIEDLIDLFGADCSSAKETRRGLVAEQHAALVAALGQMREEDLRPKLPAGIGNAIMERFGLKPGREVGEMRQRLDEMLVNGDINQDDSVESMLKKLEGK